jgi:hypothetical protein
MEVDDGAAQVRVEGLVGPKVPEPTDAAHEGVVDEILGLRTVAGQQESQSVGGRHMPNVEVGQFALGLCHRRPFLHFGPCEGSRHTLKTHETPGRYRRAGAQLRFSPSRSVV